MAVILEITRIMTWRRLSKVLHLAGMAAFVVMLGGSIVAVSSAHSLQPSETTGTNTGIVTLSPGSDVIIHPSTADSR